jgi:hypothetical protein
MMIKASGCQFGRSFIICLCIGLFLARAAGPGVHTRLRLGPIGGALVVWAVGLVKEREGVPSAFNDYYKHSLAAFKRKD